MVARQSSLSRPSRTLRAKVAAARIAAAASRAAGRGGTSLPGKLLLALDKGAISELAGQLPAGTAVISATNGKTTTATMTAAILEDAGHRLVHNHAGANMAGGVAGALLAAAPDAELGLFEVDEFWLDGLVDQLAPRALLLSNLFRDQLDRYGELETIVQRWQALLDSQPGLQVVLNADDPVIADLGRGRDNVLYFGIEDRSVGTGELDHAADARHCRRCGAPYSYEVVFLAHLGHYACDSCGSARPDPQITVDRVALSGLSGSSFALRLPAWSAEIEIPLPGLYNVYNALAAAALAHALGVSEAATRSGLDRTAAAFGRGESVVVGGQSLLLLLIKNPAGANEVLRTLALEKRPVRLLAMLNDRIADGRDVSWVWDADYETLAGHVSEVVCSGDRAAELAVRLKYAGLHPETLLVEPDPSRALDLLVKRAAGTDDRLVAIPTYTAMLELREVLVARGVAAGSFE